MIKLFVTSLFISVLFRELQCFPDVWSLIEWSDWLTPRNSKRRYDTVFYMCFVETKPSASPDGIEVKSAIVSVMDYSIHSSYIVCLSIYHSLSLSLYSGLVRRKLVNCSCHRKCCWHLHSLQSLRYWKGIVMLCVPNVEKLVLWLRNYAYASNHT